MPPEGTEAIVKPAAEHGEFLRFGILAEIAAFHDVLHKLSTTPCIGGAEHLGIGNVEDLKAKISEMFAAEFDYAEIASAAQTRYNAEAYYEKIMKEYQG